MYKGRLAPFWQLFKGEKLAGLTYHLLDEGIDTGPIVYQEAIPIAPDDDVNSLIAKMFSLATERFGHVLEVLSQPNSRERFIKHPSDAGTYYSSPRLKDAIAYRQQRFRQIARPLVR